MNSIAECISAYLNDEASAEEVQRIFEWIRADRVNAQEFARMCSLHAHLREHIGGERGAKESGANLELGAIADLSEPADLDRPEHPVHSPPVHCQAFEKRPQRESKGPLRQSKVWWTVAAALAACVVVATSITLVMRGGGKQPLAQPATASSSPFRKQPMLAGCAAALIPTRSPVSTDAEVSQRHRAIAFRRWRCGHP